MTTKLTVTVSGESGTTYNVSVSPSSYTLGPSGGTIKPVVHVSLQTGAPAVGVPVSITGEGNSISGSGTTDGNGNATVPLDIPPNTTTQTETYIFVASASSSGSGSGGGGGGGSGGALPAGTYPIEYAGSYQPGFNANGTYVGTGDVTVTDGSAVGYYRNAKYYINSEGDYYTLVSSPISGGTKTLVIKYGLVTISKEDGHITIS
ncbi:MAG: hypothetical protein QXH07_06260 [Thermoplasmata archaeon]